MQNPCKPREGKSNGKAIHILLNLREREIIQVTVKKGNEGDR